MDSFKLCLDSFSMIADTKPVKWFTIMEIRSTDLADLGDKLPVSCNLSLQTKVKILTCVTTSLGQGQGYSEQRIGTMSWLYKPA